MSTVNDPFFMPNMDTSDIFDRILLKAYNDTLQIGFTSRVDLYDAAFGGWKGDTFEHIFPQYLQHLLEEKLVSKGDADGYYFITVKGIQFIEMTKGKYKNSPYKYHLSINISENLQRKYGFRINVVTIILALIAIIISVIALVLGTLAPANPPAILP